MRQPLRRTTALIATAALALSLSACTAGQWVAEAPPAAGVQAETGGLKLRNFVVVSDDAGEAVLLGSITSRDETVTVDGITVAPEKNDGTFADPQELAFSEEIYEGRTINFDGTQTTFSSGDLLMGRLADVNVAFSNGQTMNLKAPVMSAEHEDFAEAYEKSKG